MGTKVFFFSETAPGLALSIAINIKLKIEGTGREIHAAL
jgi:hypothetical protein